MSAFARAIATLHADSDLSTPCGWYWAWNRPAPRGIEVDFQADEATMSVDLLALRGVETRPSSLAFGTGPLNSVAPQRALDIAIADVPVDVEYADLVGIGADLFTVESPEVDVECLTWRLTLSEVV